MEFVKITRPGNRPDRILYGCVPYEYEIARCQLTNAEWVAFVNATGIGWHKDMSTGVLGGIDKLPHSQDTSPTSHTHRHTSHTFSPKPGWEKKPVVYVDYLSLCRYCNWLTSGDTENGSYDMRGELPRRMKGAKYFIPNDDEWYKAAYWRQAENRYVAYPTGDELPQLDQANFERGDELAVGPPYYFADVDAFASAATPEGVIQMGGNAWEMLENVERLKGCKVGKTKGRRDGECWLNTYRGGSFGYTETGLSKTNRDTAPYNGRCYVFGVRIARCEAGWRPCRKPVRFVIIEMVYRCLRLCKRFVRKSLSLVRF